MKAYSLRTLIRDRRFAAAAAITAGPTLLAAALAIGGCGDQPKVGCLVAPGGGFATKLTEKSREGTCDDFGPDSFNADPELGINTYYARNGKGQVDYFKGSVAVQSIEIGTLVDTAAMFDVENSVDSEQYSLGKFDTPRPDADNICTAPELTPTHLVLDELPAVPDDPDTEEDDSFPGQPAVDITLEWSNFKVYTGADSVGNQIEADLTDTRKTPDGDTCTIKYHAVALNPAVSCQASDDAGDPAFKDDGSPEIDPTLCNSDADPSKERFTGSGITPNTKWVCDPVIAYCVPDGKTIPQFK